MILKSEYFKLHFISELILVKTAIKQLIQGWFDKYYDKKHHLENMKYIRSVEKQNDIKQLAARIHQLESALADAQFENQVYRTFIKASEKNEFTSDALSGIKD